MTTKITSSTDEFMQIHRDYHGGVALVDAQRVLSLRQSSERLAMSIRERDDRLRTRDRILSQLESLGLRLSEAGAIEYNKGVSYE